MIDWVSFAAIVLIASIVGFGWWKGWSMLFTLIIAMGLVFILGLATTTGIRTNIVGSPLLADLAWRPAYLSFGAWPHWFTAVTSMFLHADIMHFLVNIVIFAFIGMGFEERVGRGRFLLVFLVTGFLGTVLHSVENLGSVIPVVGASGAVFGVMAAYATMYPRDRVVLFFFLIIPNVPVYIAAVLYTAMELVTIFSFASSGVAHYAHLGGLIMGVFMGLALTKAMGRAKAGDAAGSARGGVEVAPLLDLVRSDEQRHLYERLVENKDEPELAQAWLERLARATPCPRCGERLEAAKGAFRCSCGYRLAFTGRRKTT